MIVKERAVEIYNQFENQIKSNCQPITVNGVVKQCAIMHVKGIIEVLDIFPRHQMTPFEIEILDYWKEVLTIIKGM